MDCYNVAVSELLKLFPKPECCLCSRDPGEVPQDQEWVIYNDHLIFCPDCAHAEGLCNQE